MDALQAFWLEKRAQFPGGIYLWVERDALSVLDFFERSPSDYIAWLKQRGPGGPPSFQIFDAPDVSALYLLRGTSHRVSRYLRSEKGKVRVDLPARQAGHLKGDLERLGVVVREQGDIRLADLEQTGDSVGTILLTPNAIGMSLLLSKNRPVVQILWRDQERAFDQQAPDVPRVLLGKRPPTNVEQQEILVRQVPALMNELSIGTIGRTQWDWSFGNVNQIVFTRRDLAQLLMALGGIDESQLQAGLEEVQENTATLGGML